MLILMSVRFCTIVIICLFIKVRVSMMHVAQIYVAYSINYPLISRISVSLNLTL